MKKVLVMIPTAGKVHPACHKALLSQDYPNLETMIYVQKYEKMDKNRERDRALNISKCRKMMKILAINSDADYFMWLDSDVILPKDAISNLMKQLEQPEYNPVMWAKLQEQFKDKDISPKKKHIVSGWYPTRTHGLWNAGRMVADHVIFTLKRPEPSLTTVDTIHFGCTLMSREVFEKIDYKTGFDWMLNGTVGVCECHIFCNDAVELGYTLYMDGSVICKHLLPSKLKSNIVDFFKRIVSNIYTIPERFHAKGNKEHKLQV